MFSCVSSLLLLAGVAFGFTHGGLSAYRYTIETAKDLPVVEEYESKFWHNDALGNLEEKVNHKIKTNKAKNLILFLGDGMSIPTIAAARIYRGQLNQRTGENSKLSFERFPSTGLSKTYCVDKQVADSACSSTAYLGGVKANYGTLGVTAAVPLGNCTQSMNKETHVQSILMWAQAAGKGTGLVTTAAITDASPAGGYSHTAHREWQSDKDLKDFGIDPKMCPDIAHQLIRSRPGSDVKVILGGGHKKFLSKESNSDHGVSPGERLDGVDLIDEWYKDKLIRNKSAKFVYDRKGLLVKNITKNDFIFGLFQPNDMLYHLEDGAELQPSLEEMTQVAIERLQREPNGYYLFIEGALIDKAHHKNWAHRALDETVEFSKAIEMAVKLTNEDDTLIVVTADHAHTMSMSGYPKRGNDILGITKNENQTYPTLAYINGPSAPTFSDIENHDYARDDISSDTYLYPSLVNLADETHGGDDVAVFARGPWSHLFSGVYEENLIPHMMGYAANIGPAANLNSLKFSQIKSSSTTMVLSSYSIVFLIFSVIFSSNSLWCL